MNYLSVLTTPVIVGIAVAVVVVLVAIVLIVVLAKKHAKRKVATSEVEVAEGSEEQLAPEDQLVAEEQPTQEEAKAEQPKKNTVKTYHISKRKEEGKWQVKLAGGKKAIKMFLTQAEAIEYAKVLATNQDARIVIHKEDGTFRRLTYKKK